MKSYFRDMAEKAWIGAEFNLWPLTTCKQEFWEIWYIAYFKCLTGYLNYADYKKKLRCSFWAIFKNVDFYAQNELIGGPGTETMGSNLLTCQINLNN